MTIQQNQITVFLSYAHEDEAWLKKLTMHLRLLQRQKIISVWHDRQIVAGTDWSKTIDQHLEQASLILLLVSADFLASDYCYEVEMQRALKLHELGQTRVIPVAIRPADWTGAPFAHLHALPTDAKPLSSWHDPDTALVDVVAGLRRALEDLAFSPASTIRRTLPPLWMIPYPRNLFFLGRDPILDLLHSHLHSGKYAALSQSPSAISGLGGIGKTQIAVEYAYRYHQEYEAVLWARAEKHEDLLSSFLAIATHLRLPQREEKDQEVIIAAVKAWLQTHQRWLLILDNADDLDLVPSFLPPAAGGHILLTTRAWDMQRLAIRLEVESLSNEQGAVLLTLRSGLLTAESDWEYLSADDRRVALRLTQQLGGLPLALDQAGAYLEATGCSLQDYEELYQQHRLSLFRERRSRVLDHPEGVITTWSLSFERVQMRHPAATDLLRLCAFLAPDAIAEELLTVKPDVLGPLLAPLAVDVLQRNQAIEALRAYSLIRRDPREKILSVHRLVQAVLRETLKKEEQQVWAERAMQVINAAFPWPEYATWDQCERLLAQALSAAELIEQYYLSIWEIGPLLSASASYLAARARYAEAEPLYQRELHIWEQSLGPEHLLVTSPLNGLANLYAEQGKYAEAEPCYQRALHIMEQSLGPEHLLVATSFNNLANLYKEQGKYAEAESLYQRALYIREQSLGSKHPEVATPLNGLANLYAEQGKYAEAEPLYQRALHIWEQSLGSEHPEVAISFNNLASLYAEQGKYVEAESLYQRALRIREQSLGSEHPEVATSLNGLANLYEEQGKYAEAELLYQRALRIWKQSLGSEHLKVAAPLDNLANLYKEQGKYAEAEPLYQRALHIWEQSLGSEHPEVATSLNGLASLYAEQGKYAEAESLYQRALHIWEQSLGSEHLKMAISFNNLASLYKEQGKYAEAESFYQRALHIWKQNLGSEHPEVAYPLNGLASLYKEQGKYAEAEPLYQRALHIWKQSLGSEHPKVAYPLNGLASLYKEQGKYAEAEPLYQRALHIWEQSLGSEHPKVAYPLNGLASLYKEQGKYAEAELLYQRALRIREQSLGSEHLLTQQIRQNYVLFLRAMKSEGEAKTLEEGI